VTLNIKNGKINIKISLLHLSNSTAMLRLLGWTFAVVSQVTWDLPLARVNFQVVFVIPSMDKIKISLLPL